MYRYRLSTADGQLIADREVASPQAIATRVAPEFLDDIQAACTRFDADGEPQLIYIGSESHGDRLLIDAPPTLLPDLPDAERQAIEAKAAKLCNQDRVPLGTLAAGGRFERTEDPTLTASLWAIWNHSQADDVIRSFDGRVAQIGRYLLRLEDNATLKVETFDSADAASLRIEAIAEEFDRGGPVDDTPTPTPNRATIEAELRNLPTRGKASKGLIAGIPVQRLSGKRLGPNFDIDGHTAHDLEMAARLVLKCRELTGPRRTFDVPSTWRAQWPLSTLAATTVNTTHAPNGDLLALQVTRGDTEIDTTDLEAAELDAAIARYAPDPAEYLADFLNGYVTCSLWSSTNPDTDGFLDGGGTDDCGYDARDLDGSAALTMADDCARFLAAHLADLIRFEELTGRDFASHGHDLWLTRNHHGAGFWDRYMEAEPEHREAARELGERLSAPARALGECELYPGDDGRLYVAGAEPPLNP